MPYITATPTPRPQAGPPPSQQKQATPPRIPQARHRRRHIFLETGIVTPTSSASPEWVKGQSACIPELFIWPRSEGGEVRGKVTER